MAAIAMMSQRFTGISSPRGRATMTRYVNGCTNPVADTRSVNPNVKDQKTYARNRILTSPRPGILRAPFPFLRGSAPHIYEEPRKNGKGRDVAAGRPFPTVLLARW